MKERSKLHVNAVCLPGVLYKVWVEGRFAILRQVRKIFGISVFFSLVARFLLNVGGSCYIGGGTVSSLSLGLRYKFIYKEEGGRGGGSNDDSRFLNI